MSISGYEEYQNSHNKWLGDVPISWSVIPARRLFSNRREAAKGLQQLAVTQNLGVVPQKEYMRAMGKSLALALKGTDSFRGVEKGDFVISLRSFEGGIEFSEHQGCVSPAYTVLAPSKYVIGGYFKHLYKSEAFISALQTVTDSLRDGKSITYEQLSVLSLPCPPKGEQKTIAAFLDYETAKIDELIAKQKRLIALLKEKRQAVISHAVTKGLNPNAPMKDSGVEWLGEVPEHWAVSDIRHLYSAQGGGTPSKDKAEFWTGGDIPWVSPKDMKRLKIDSAEDKITDAAVEASSVKLIDSGAVLIVVRGMILLHSVPVALTAAPVTINQDMKALTATPLVTPEYLLLMLRGLRDAVLDLVETSAHGTKCLRTEQFERMSVAFPSLREQISIVEKIGNQEAILIDGISSSSEMIELLKERRSALISAAVTGKIDVRGWVAPAASNTQ